jgi:hypothetical protein
MPWFGPDTIEFAPTLPTAGSSVALLTGRDRLRSYAQH